MGESDVFGKLSRIFETHGFLNDQDKEGELSEIFEDFGQNGIERIDRNDKYSKDKNTPVLLADRPTPYEVWHAKHQGQTSSPKEAPKLSGQQWDKLVDKMHRSNRTKQNAMIEKQNQGLAAELGGFQFKPRMNKTSLDISATMKSLVTRMPEMIEERDKFLESERKKKILDEEKECTFAPKRYGAKTSDMYLKKLGRDRVTPEDFFQYNEEKMLRNALRKQIVQEVEEKELTFKPQIGERSQKIQGKLIKTGVIGLDPTTRTTVVKQSTMVAASSTNEAISPHGLERIRRMSSAPIVNAASDLYEGPVLVIESEHPYRHNTNEYTTVQVPGAISYLVSFHDDTRTEAIYDYVKFYDDDTHTHYFGSGKYSGGAFNSACNWPGTGNRPPLLIPTSKFIIYFKTNGTINDWGFRMHIVPTLSTAPEDSRGLLSKSVTPLGGSIPNLVAEASKNYKAPNGQVHNRLYTSGIEKKMETHNNQFELMQTKLKLSAKPWEVARDMTDGIKQKFFKMNSKSHLPKATLADAVDELVVASADEMEDAYDTKYPMHKTKINSTFRTTTDRSGLSSFVTVEYEGDTVAKLWKHLHSANLRGMDREQEMFETNRNSSNQSYEFNQNIR